MVVVREGESDRVKDIVSENTEKDRQNNGESNSPLTTKRQKVSVERKKYMEGERERQKA